MPLYESPKYTIIFKNKAFEIREYQEYYTSSIRETSLSGNNGFGKLFSYISGNNEQKEKLSMTVPVINTIEKDEMTMEFVIPSKYKGKSIPIPNNNSLSIKHYPKHYAAAYRFSGSTNQTTISNNLARLEVYVSEFNLVAKKHYKVARFNPPFSLPFLRHNEILLELESDSAKKFLALKKEFLN